MKNLIQIILLIIVFSATSCQKEKTESLYSITYNNKTYYTSYYSTNYNTNKKPCITFTDNSNNSATNICGDYIVKQIK